LLLEVEDEILPPPTKKPCTEDFFGDLFTASKSKPINDELQSYLTCNETSEDILAFWRQKAAIWPKLAIVARTVNSIPATETSSERMFSLAGRTMEDRRSQLNSETVDDLLVVHGLGKLHS